MVQHHLVGTAGELNVTSYPRYPARSLPSILQYSGLTVPVGYNFTLTCSHESAIPPSSTEYNNEMTLNAAE